MCGSSAVTSNRRGSHYRRVTNSCRLLCSSGEGRAVGTDHDRDAVAGLRIVRFDCLWSIALHAARQKSVYGIRHVANRFWRVSELLGHRRKSLGPGVVGPEPMILGSSPTTSERTSVTIGRAVPSRSSPPPFVSDKCFRTVFMSLISAPDANSRRFTCILSFNVTGARGPTRRLDAPPLIRPKHRPCRGGGDQATHVVGVHSLPGNRESGGQPARL